MAELAVKRKKKIKNFFKLQACIGGWLFWVWVGGGCMRKGKAERQRIEVKREEREIFYIILLRNLYYFNM